MEINTVPIQNIKPYEKNPRKNDEAVAKVAASIKEFGFRQPIVADRNGIIIAGHTRYKAAVKIGLKEIPVLYASDLTDAQVKAYRLADNKTAEYSTWDLDLLLSELAELDEINYDMAQFGFEMDSKTAKDDDFDLEAAIDAAGPPTTKPGDIWTLGRHRLICGDSTKPATIRSLMAGSKADIYITDPPYNVDYEGSTADKLKIANDNMSGSVFKKFLTDAFTAADSVIKPGAVFYIWHADTEALAFRNACADTGWQVRQCLVWVKNTFRMGRQDYQWRHEPCLYGWKSGAAHYFLDDRTQSTVTEQPKIDFKSMNKTEMLALLEKTFGEDTPSSVFRENKPSRNAEHPTMKPVNLIGKLIKNSSRPGALILDSFGGSGSTIMAAEQLDRVCFSAEIDPIYCDVIIKRFETMTKTLAYRAETGRVEW